MDDRLHEFIKELAEQAVTNAPKPGQVWKLREGDEVADLLISAKKWDPPKEVLIDEIEVRWGGTELVKGCTPDGRHVELDCFTLLYELHRPSVWERLSSPDVTP